MIIDARTAGSPKHHRPYTVLGAVELFLDGIQVGDTAEVSDLLDSRGRRKDLGYFNVAVNKTKGERSYKVRSNPLTEGRVVYRVA